MSEEKKEQFDSGEPSLDKISDYHKPMSASKQKTILIALLIGVVLAGGLYIMAFVLSS